MQLRKGDQVRFLNETGGGTVMGFKDQNVVNVLIDEGFEIPVLISELVKIDEDNEDIVKDQGEPFTETVHVEELNIEENSDKLTCLNEDDGIYLGILPVVQTGHLTGDYKFYLINDSDYRVFFMMGSKEDGNTIHFKSGQLENNMKLLLETLDYNRIRELDNIHIQMILFTGGRFKSIDPIVYDYQFKKNDLTDIKVFKDNDFFDDSALIFKMENIDFGEELDKIDPDVFKEIIEVKEKTNEQKVGDFMKKKKNKKNTDIEEVDLHIESILEDYDHLTPGEIINAQLDRFNVALEGALRGKSRRIVFIHGVGNGKLKYELRKTLDRKYPDLNYHDASFQEYGYGATMVILK